MARAERSDVAASRIGVLERIGDQFVDQKSQGNCVIGHERHWIGEAIVQLIKEQFMRKLPVPTELELSEGLQSVSFQDCRENCSGLGD
jgi:hypothetical protein